MVNTMAKANELAHLLIKEFTEELRDSIDKKIGVLFSGGIDSTIIVRLSSMLLGWENLTLYTVGVDGSRDLKNAREGAHFFDISWKTLNVTDEMILSGATSLLTLIPELNFLELSFELPLFLGADMIKEKILLTGQGADELFGGYARYLDAEDPLILMKEDRERLLTRTIINESMIASYHNKTLISPFINENIMNFTSTFDKEDVIGKDGTNKVILRETARILGLPEIFCNRRKIAAQYGSGISKVLKKLKKEGKIGSTDNEIE